MAVREGKITSSLAFIEVRTKKVNKTIQSLIRFNKETEKIARKTFNKMLATIKKSIKKEVPRITGALRKSIKILVNKKRVKTDFIGIIGPDDSAVNKAGESYAPFVVFGTSRNAPNNFLKRGFDKAQPEIKKLVRQMGRDIKSAVRKSKT